METVVKHSNTSDIPVDNRDELRSGLEESRAAFHELVARVTQDQWRQQPPGSRWTVGEILVHLTWALEYLPKEVEQARRGKGMFNMPKWIADPGSYWMTRWLARTATPKSVQQRYDSAMDATIAALETVPETDWKLGANFYGEGFYTVADLFRAPGQHLMHHTADIQRRQP